MSSNLIPSTIAELIPPPGTETLESSLLAVSKPNSTIRWKARAIARERALQRYQETWSRNGNYSKESPSVGSSQRDPQSANSAIATRPKTRRKRANLMHHPYHLTIFFKVQTGAVRARTRETPEVFRKKKNVRILTPSTFRSKR